MESFPLIDIHTHQHYAQGRTVIRINSLMVGEDLPQANEFQYYSIGIHPYQLQRISAQLLVDQFEVILQSVHPIAIGEAGFDKSIPVPMALQEEIFMYQAKKASELELPLMIHAVRAFPELIRLKKQFNSHVPWILHGFNGNEQTISQLSSKGFFFSVGPSLLNPRQKIHQSIISMPLDRLFFETDAAKTTIESVYKSAAYQLNLTPEALLAQIYQNFITHFHLL